MKRNKFILMLATVCTFTMLASGVQAAPIQVLKAPDSANTNFVAGELTAPTSASEKDIFYKYLNENKSKYKFDSSAENSFMVESVELNSEGQSLVRSQQVYNDVPVYASSQKSIIDENGVLKSVSGTISPELSKIDSLKKDVKVTSKEALSTAQKSLGLSPKYEVIPSSNLVIYKNNYAYHVKLSFLDPSPGYYDIFVDAISGKIVDKINKISNATVEVGTGKGVLGDTKSFNVSNNNGKYYLYDSTRGNGIYTYDAKNGTSLPGSLFFKTTNTFTAAKDAALVDAHYYSTVAYDFYKNVFGRNSYDGRGAAIKSTAHYKRNYNNAFWNGSQLVYGDGDGTRFIAFSGALDIIAHELTHAVTEKTANLVYKNESGAINESVSDIMGTLAEYYDNRNPDWLCGEDVYTPGKAGDSLRSLENPAINGLPDHYTKMVDDPLDGGGVHSNSSIINKAAFLIANGGTHYNVTVKGIGNDKLGKILYYALVNYMSPNETMKDMRGHMIQAATYYYGASSAEVTSVTKAYDAVGVK